MGKFGDKGKKKLFIEALQSYPCFVADCHYGQDITMAFSPPVVGCLVKKGLQKGGQGHPRTPLGYALAAPTPAPVMCVMAY